MAAKAGNLSRGSGNGNDMPDGRPAGYQRRRGGRGKVSRWALGRWSEIGRRGGGLPERTHTVIGPRLEVGRGGADKVDEVISIGCASCKKPGGRKEHPRFIQIP